MPGMSSRIVWVLNRGMRLTPHPFGEIRCFLDKIVWSSKSVEWGTPDLLYRRLDAKYSFNLDPASTKQNNLISPRRGHYMTTEGVFASDTHELVEAGDGLSLPWGFYGNRVFVNPPYGRDIWKWVKKAATESQQDALVVMLLPVRTGTRWWRDWVVPYADIEYLSGRLTFKGAPNAAPFDSAIVRYR